MVFCFKHIIVEEKCHKPILCLSKTMDIYIFVYIHIFIQCKHKHVLHYCIYTCNLIGVYEDKERGWGWGGGDNVINDQKFVGNLGQKGKITCACFS